MRSGRDVRAAAISKTVEACGWACRSAAVSAACYAGVWGHYAARDGILDPGDVEEGLTTAAAIGDDRLQQQSQGRVVPESFTHGSSAQRVSWLRRGLESGPAVVRYGGHRQLNRQNR
jgi:predicted metalloprotease